MKKTFITILAVLLAAVLLAGCVTTPENSSSGAESSQDDSSAAESSAEASSEAEPSVAEASSEAESSAPAINPIEYHIVALGDSITAGYGLDQPDEQRYTSVMLDALASRGFTGITCDNYAVSGDNTQNLLDLLKAGSAKTLADADAVILCIGANDVLLPIATTLFPQLGGIGSEFSKLISAIFKGEDTSAVYDSIKQKADEVAELVESAEFKKTIDDGVAMFNENLPVIIAEIRKVNPDCKIYYGNIYNPYRDFDTTALGFAESLDTVKLGDDTVGKLNAVINSKAEELGYTVVDIYSVIDACEERPINAAIDLSTAYFNVDPHPNVLGHELIGAKYADMFADILSREEA